MADFLFTAKYVDEDFKIVRYYILEETDDMYLTVTREGEAITFPNIITQIAFTELDAILALINSYSNSLFKQRQMQNVYDRKYR